ncbi:thiamine diphosphate-binding protein [Eremomyces bilateralis CBS 781.70]|uniref:Sulfite reductase [NADPH] subunit beta n=1 Tax=Eremomyces bilateralis CBS 781.70 TaxID=1392243 RepID=A0A6G1GGJ8_9PEZI|nr:thiamine diphosphate-binding protein [Eremomyces bilateralis CBS 781.70]KAF1817031.1 thiamine diphosphate-binding protein [Eremomyces bilateralis CBS 781.70]
MASISSAGEAVSRVAYLSSDAVVSVQPSLAQDSEFSSHLREYATKQLLSIVSRDTPEILSVRHNADPLLSVFDPIRSGKLVSVTTTSSVLLRAIPYLYKLAHYPVVIHVSLEPGEYPDYSSITSIRQCGFIFLQSESLQEVQDLAVSAHALAIKSGKGVIHFFNSNATDQDNEIKDETRELVKRVVDVDGARLWQAAKSDDWGIYADEGRRATTTVFGEEKPLITGVPSQLDPAVSERLKQDNASARESSATSSSNADSSGDSAPISSAATSIEPASTRPINTDDISKHIGQIWDTIHDLTGRTYEPFSYSGSSRDQAALFVFGADTALLAKAIDSAGSTDQFAKVGIITARLYRPWLTLSLADLLPKSLKKIAVLEQVRRKTTKWGPLLLDVLATIRTPGSANPSIVGYQLGYITEATAQQALKGIFQNLALETPIQNLTVGQPDGPNEEQLTGQLQQPELENAYFKILDQLFPERLYVANRLGKSTAGLEPTTSNSPEFGLGSLISRQEAEARFVEKVKQLVKNANPFITSAPQDWLSKWLLARQEPKKLPAVAQDTLSRLNVDGSTAASDLLSQKSFFLNESRWLIGSDAWAYDLANSGVHHVLASGLNINMLIIDSTPYSEKAAADASRRKKDIGLYAMNFGNAYVASVAVYGSYTQVLSAMLEADSFDGPSIVMAYLPYFSETESPLTVMQETKKAIDIGYWPLYRWNPKAEENSEPNFHLDSERVKQELKEFLRRDQHMSQVMRKHPEFAPALNKDYGKEVRALQKRKAKDAYAQLLEGLAGAPMTVLFASDNGNAENLAKRLANRGKARGLKTIAMAMDDYPIEDISTEENIVLVTSTAGQGEFPQNGRSFWEAVKNSTDIDLVNVHFAVFSLGDSHYWPRKQDKIYYNKPGKDLHTRFLALGGQPLVDCGLGDDQDPDAYQTGYQEWEPQLWQALGVSNVEGLPEEPPPITNEDIKIASNFLRGTIVEGLNDPTTGAISASDSQLTKFHGTYMQDDRDLRDERKAQGLEPAYSFMIRCRLPGGVATPDQWIKMDDIATTLGNETMKLTTRQTFQFHGVVKGKLKPAMQAINRALMTTIAACGDVNRNVMCSVIPDQSAFHAEVHAVSKRVSDHLLPNTTAYHEIWLKDEDDKKTLVAGDAVVDNEPLYGPTYLPRKFKITIAVPPHNDTDVYAHDIGLIAIKGKDGSLEGFNVTAGGGMGATHNNKKTYPQIGRMMGYVAKKDTHIACEKIMLVQRDHGDRKNRKHARLKYTIDDLGVDVFRSKVEEIWGKAFEPERSFKFESNIDTFGWQKDENGLNHFMLFIENGRIEDTPEFPMKTGLREVAKVHKGEFRLSPNQHLVLSKVADEDVPVMKELLKKYKLDNTDFSALRLSSSACVAFPTCGLAMAESERYLPELITKLESTIEEAGLRQDSIVMRMTGCPNGCARPWLAEVAFVGKAFGAYNMYLGGGYHGQRLNKLYRSSIKEDEILEILRPMMKQYAKEREEGERFGDWCVRAGYIKATREGRDFHEDTAEVEEDDEE